MYQHFMPNDREARWSCNYCSEVVGADTNKHGTTNLWKHRKKCRGRGGGGERGRGREAERAGVAGRDAARGQGGGDAGAVVGGGQPLGGEPARAPRRHRAVAGDLGVHAAQVLPPPVPAAVPGQAHQGVPGAPPRPALAGVRVAGAEAAG